MFASTLPKSAPRRLKLLALTGLLAACGNSTAPLAVEPDAPPASADKVFEAIRHEIIPLPAGVEPWAPTWSPDGEHILFNNIVDGTEWIVQQDGTGLFCLTCSMDDVVKIPGAFSYVFPDNKRMFYANELGDAVYVLECAPSLYDCTHHELLPVDLSADTPNPLKISVGRRTYHLSPSGEHLAYSNTRLDALVMMVAELVRTGTGYAAINPKVINPKGPEGGFDTNIEGWANGGQLYEFKSFADGGASAIIVGQPSDGNADALKVNLANGATTRLTSDVDWDEDGAESPDGRLYVNASWRTMGRLEAFGVMPLGKPLFTYPAGAAVAIYYVSSFPGFQCDLQPWLLPAGGDKGGTLTGQPLAPYKGGDIITGNNLAALSYWSPDSTRVLIQERMKTPVDASANDAHKQKGHSPNRLLIARVRSTPTTPKPVVRTVVGDWAPAVADYTGNYQLPHVPIIAGKAAGYIIAIYGGNVAAGAFSATYVNYSEDGENFLNGTIAVVGSALLGVAVTSALTSSDAAGNRTGGSVGFVQFTKRLPEPPAGEPPFSKSGSISSDYKGRMAAELPEVGACYDSMPTPAALSVATSIRDRNLIVNVKANIFGDERPIRQAKVYIGNKAILTDDAGNAGFAMPGGKVTIRVDAGDTFLPASITR